MDEGHNSVEPDPVTTTWRYAGVSQVVNVGTSYAWSPRLTLRGDVEWVRGANTFISPAPDTALDPDGNVINPDWSTLPGNSEVIVETSKISAGTDYWVTKDLSVYFTYNLFNYNGLSLNESGNSGTAHYFLSGINAIY